MIKSIIYIVFLCVLFYSCSHTKGDEYNQQIRTNEYFAYGNMKQNKKVGYWFYYFQSKSYFIEGNYSTTGYKEGIWKYYNLNRGQLKIYEFESDTLNGYAYWVIGGDTVKREKYYGGVQSNIVDYYSKNDTTSKRNGMGVELILPYNEETIGRTSSEAEK